MLLPRQIVFQLFERFGEVDPPETKAGTDGPTDDVNGRAALELGKKLVENSAVALPYVSSVGGEQSWNVKYLEDNPRAEMFLRYIEHLDRMILRSMFVPERILSGDGEHGSYALSKVHADIFLLCKEAPVVP